MGGRGSTRWKGHQKAWTVEDWRVVRWSAEQLAKQASDSGAPLRVGHVSVRGHSQALPADECDGETAYLWLPPVPLLSLERLRVFASLPADATADETRAAFDRARVHDPMCQPEPEVLALRPYHSGMGLRRWLVVCPHCGKNTRFVYHRAGEVFRACRKCNGLTYRSAQQHDKRVDAIRRSERERAAIMAKIEEANHVAREPVDPADGWAALEQVQAICAALDRTRPLLGLLEKADEADAKHGPLTPRPRRAS